LNPKSGQVTFRQQQAAAGTYAPNYMHHLLISIKVSGDNEHCAAARYSQQQA
tara:strand:+ start:866 stop:1021 length:156 start_codon:yes stop_codon:yes gene_type:complete